MTQEGKPVRCIAVIQCHVALERCSGVHCSVSAARREHHYSGHGKEVEFYLPFSCGGCPGRRISRLAANVIKMMKKMAGVEREEIVVHLSTCMVSDNGHYPPCPHLADIKKILARKKLKVVEGTYVSRTAEERRQSGYYYK